ncbi:hypothetical protein [Streptomyces halobius]|uniref:Uncharacterized protein n=1 Tax=Streptomyces halobius TaxID=2879846 RepID=A0ABY4MA07_9ACTN|nr:hypothetical protein [Streptomyces halobius]UQA94252.1 hypothetical protein K9S39_22475 [Streptomyces halobius]
MRISCGQWSCVHEAPQGQYDDWNRFAIAEGLRDTAAAATDSGEVGDAGARRAVDESADEPMRELPARWCARADLKALGLTLPAYLGYLVTDGDRMRLVTAPHSVHAARRPPADEQTELGAVIGALALR